ncbi:amino acid ABC transporter permease [Duganella sp. BJB488]|uniref:amino acid ABC transporter permease n=1 Tax=unclassified Duganella TaxID=2636909 RepID=UPI000E346648|nr:MULTISPECIES: amino acid ABC transporter permease [unclassified Duganella]NVD69774.1 amino acid ABC transporter permease [Duganella sp. BJB1802]RFP08771.1 amino acid ABC transporter permease [Duganella sp. BJB489]RFP18187.1 amino acid ABC transporter permease [Duganella sp. BJB488]RFP37948.1 amino acid ABC transporter permease [Duganella sp. BJB480]
MDSQGLLELLREAAPVMLRGAGYTVVFALASMLGGLLIGFPVAVMRILPYRALRWPAGVYVSLMRGTPLLVQMFVIYYGLPSVGIEFTPVTAGILALSLNAGAFLSESLRGAIAAVSKGQWAASYSLGLGYWRTLRFVVLPQALRIAVPAMSNTLISLIKDTSLVSVITMTELMLSTKEVIATTFRPLPLYLAAAGIYWMLSLLFEALQRRAEQRLNRAHR